MKMNAPWEHTTVQRMLYARIPKALSRVNAKMAILGMECLVKVCDTVQKKLKWLGVLDIILLTKNEACNCSHILCLPLL